jgi:hypothetical protein
VGVLEQGLEKLPGRRKAWMSLSCALCTERKEVPADGRIFSGSWQATALPYPDLTSSYLMILFLAPAPERPMLPLRHCLLHSAPPPLLALHNMACATCSSPLIFMASPCIPELLGKLPYPPGLWLLGCGFPHTFGA